MKAKKVVRGILLGILGFLLVVLLTVQFLLRPSVLTRLVNKYAAEYVEGSLEFSKVRASVFRSFPNLNVSIDSCALTYPHERYQRFDSLYEDSGLRFSLQKMGLGAEGTDTLASFDRLEVSLNYMALIRGRYNIHKAILEHPRIFAHYFDSTAANWDILPLGEDDPADTVSSPTPPISLSRIQISGRPLVVYTNPADTMHLMLAFRKLALDGSISTDDLPKAHGELGIDSLFLSGRLPADTVALRLEHLGASAERRHVNLELDAKAFLASGSFGRLRVPLHIDADADIPHRHDDALELVLNSLGINISALRLDGQGNVVAHPDGLVDMDITASVDKAPLGSLIDTYRDNFPFLKKIRTDALLSVDASAKGTYGGGSIPAIDASVRIPMSTLNYEGVGRSGRLALNATATTDNSQKVNVDVSRLLVDILGAKLNLQATAGDVLGSDPVLSLDGTARARVDSLTHEFTAQDGITGTGTLNADLHGRARLSQLDLAKIGNANIDCRLDLSNLDIHDVPDTLDAFVHRATVALSTGANRLDQNMRQGARVLSVDADIDTLDVSLGRTMFVRGSGLKLLAQNSAEILRSGETLTPFMGILKVAGLRLRDEDGLAVGVRNSVERFRIHPPAGDRTVPLLELKSDSERVRMRSGTDAFAFANLHFDVNASQRVRRTRPNAERRNRLLDSLQRVYPAVPRDSLFAHARMARMASADAFSRADIDLSISRAMMKYVREWDFQANLNVDKGRVFMPAFPLRTSLSAVDASISNDHLDLRNISIQAGESDLSARADVTGLRLALMGSRRAMLNVNAALSSGYIDANELMRAYAYYSTYQPQDSLHTVSDQSIEDTVADSELPEDASAPSGGGLIIVPANMNLNLSLESTGVKYDSLMISWLAADVAMRDRTLQITNALAASNMGDLFFEGFYSTRSKDDVKAGFDLNLVDITAEKVITLFPAVDSLMPMLNSFAGNLDVEVAATTSIDTLMNLIPPTIDGIMKISGKDLGMKDSQTFTKIARLLFFKRRDGTLVDNMYVTGMIRDNVLEVFPFVLDVDRYQFAASGIQNLDSNFKYHISVIKSPLLVKFGINVWGKDFDHVRFGVGKARYRSPNVPVFTKQLDTVQYSLVAAIHNVFELGVEKAIQENQQQQFVHNQMAAVGWRESFDTTDATAMTGELPPLDTARIGSFVDDIQQVVVSRRDSLRARVLELEEEYSSDNARL